MSDGWSIVHSLTFYYCSLNCCVLSMFHILVSHYYSHKRDLLCCHIVTAYFVVSSGDMNVQQYKEVIISLAVHGTSFVNVSTLWYRFCECIYTMKPVLRVNPHCNTDVVSEYTPWYRFGECIYTMIRFCEWIYTLMHVLCVNLLHDTGLVSVSTLW